MKLRIAAVGRNQWVPGVSNINLWADFSLADFDVVLVDPLVMGLAVERRPSDWDQAQAILARRQSEIHDVLVRRGGVVVAYLRGPSVRMGWAVTTHVVSAYCWFPKFVSGSLDELLKMREGVGTDIRLTKSAHPFAAYIKAFKKSLFFDGEPEGELPPDSWVTFAATGTGRPIAFSCRIGPGTFVCIPPNSETDAKKETGVVLDCVRGMLGSAEAESPPDWARSCPVPGQQEWETEDTELAAQEETLRQQRAALHEQKQAIDRVRMLLYATGTHQLEEAVRNGLRILGFEVLEDHEGDADVYAQAPEGFAVGEVEGTDGQVDIQKHRQLLDYCEQVNESGECKGVLFGNGYRQQPPDKRSEQFTDQVIKGAKRQGFCLVPTCELFKAVCFVLGRGETLSAATKARIRRSILEDAGVWKFSPPE